MGELDDLPARELERWSMYWTEEPWGAYRDNMHAALIVTELLRPHLKEGATLNMADFMYRTKEDREQLARAKLLAQLDADAALSERKRGKKP